MPESLGKADAKIEANEGIPLIKDQGSESRVLKHTGRTSGRGKAEDLDWGSYSENGVRGSGSGNSAQDLDWSSYAENHVLGNGDGNAAQDLDWDEFADNGVLGGTGHDNDEYDDEDDLFESDEYAYDDEGFADDSFEFDDDESYGSDDDEFADDVFETADVWNNNDWDDQDWDESPPDLQEFTKLINRLANLHNRKKDAS